MVISRTPFRISFFGGGTDYPQWYLEHGGAVLATTINKYCYLTCRYLPPFFEHRYTVNWSRIENVQRPEDIEHPAARAILTYMGVDRGVKIHHDGDLPARSGIGSSSSFTIGMLNALYALHGQIRSKAQLMEEGIHIEQNVLQEHVGSQDQVMAAHGGFNRIRFHENGHIAVAPMTITPERLEELESHLMLFYTGIVRTASDVVESYVNDLEGKRRQLRIIQDLVDEGVGILNNGSDILQFGQLLHEAWTVKRELSEKISNAHVDEIYDAALDAGAVGGKLSGAGGGGFMLLFVPPHRREAVRERFKNLVYVPFRFESNGSQIIFYDPEEDFEAVERQRSEQHLEPFRELDTVNAHSLNPDEAP